VLIDIPKDVQNALTTDRHRWRPYPKQKPEMGQSEDIAKAEALMSEAKKPLFYIGGGVAQGDGVAELRELVERTVRSSKLSRHAGHARAARGQLRRARMRSFDCCRRAVR